MSLFAPAKPTQVDPDAVIAREWSRLSARKRRKVAAVAPDVARAADFLASQYVESKKGPVTRRVEAWMEAAYK